MLTKYFGEAEALTVPMQASEAQRQAFESFEEAVQPFPTTSPPWHDSETTQLPPAQDRKAARDRGCEGKKFTEE